MNSLCKSLIEPSSNPASFSNSITDPIQTISLKSSLTHKGTGVPQKRLRPNDQSLGVLNHCSNLEVPTLEGTQLIFLFNSKILSLIE